MPLTIPQIVKLYRTEGAGRHGTEVIDQQQHAFQCAQLAEAAGAKPALVAAALLHDLGHLLYEHLPEQSQRDELHEYRVLPFLRGEYPDAVLQPIRLHVAAKRFLCAMDAGYWQSLSPASKHSLELQGGSLDREQIDRFLAEPFAMDAVALRRWDDQARSPTRVTAGWDHYQRVLERASLRQPERAAA